MRTSFLLGLLLFFLSGCDPLGDRLPGFRSRTACGPHGPERRKEAPAPRQPESPTFRQLDTTFLLTAVRFPDGYDWQRDTAYGSVPFELLLYRDFEPVLTLSSGPDACFVPDPDRHHLLSGHLYTERMADGQTRVGRDGVELFRFPGREFLVGLLEDGDDLYTLSRSADGEGFSYRKNGTPLLLRSNGTPFGDLTDPSYGPSGALYRDLEQICFCFSTGSGPDRNCFYVCDGAENPVSELPPGTAVLDLKRRDGRNLVLSSPCKGHDLTEGRIWPERAYFALTGRFLDRSGRPFSGYLNDGALDEVVPLCPEEAVLYRSGRHTLALSVDASDIVRWYGTDGDGQEETPCYFLTPGCACLNGRQLWLALTPRDTRQGPFVRNGTRVWRIDVNGYVSRLSVRVSLRPS